MDNKYLAYAKYAGLVFQMGAVILFFTWCGLKLDEQLNFKQPYLTALFALIGVVVAIWQVLRSLMKLK